MLKLQKRLEQVSIIISSLLLALMMITLVANVILRYIPGIGGFKWYMEGSQYLNVWSVLIVGIALCVKEEHLNVNILEGLLKEKGKVISKLLRAFFTVLFYIGLAYGTYLLATKSRQDISTMPSLKMAYVYWMMPISFTLSGISTIIGLIANLKSLYKKGGSTL